MTLEEQIDNLWCKMVMLDAEYELAERGFNLVVEDHGLSSPEAVAANQRLNELGERLLELDKKYSAALELFSLAN